MRDALANRRLEPWSCSNGLIIRPVTLSSAEREIGHGNRHVDLNTVLKMMQRKGIPKTCGFSVLLSSNAAQKIGTFALKPASDVQKGFNFISGAGLSFCLQDGRANEELRSAH